MANDSDGGDNNIDPLLQYLISPPPPLSSLPEHDAVTIPIPTTPSKFNDRLIFDPSPSSSAATSLDLFFLLPPPELKSDPTHYRFHRSKSDPALSAIKNLTHYTEKTHHNPDRSDSRSVVRKAYALLLVYLSLALLIYWLNRDVYVVYHTNPFVDAFYFCIVTICTIGYGDFTPDSVTTKLFSILFVFVGFGFIDLLLSCMVSYVQENYTFDDEPERKRLKVGLSLGVVMLCLAFGVLIMRFVEKISWLDSFYFSVMSVTTFGYGDRDFQTVPGRLLGAIWLLVSTLAIARAFLYLAEARVDNRNRERAKRALGENMSVSEFFAADIDHNGCVSKAEFLIYKLKKMKKITDKDINLIANMFGKLDTTNSGRITLLETNSRDLSN